MKIRREGEYALMAGEASAMPEAFSQSFLQSKKVLANEVSVWHADAIWQWVWVIEMAGKQIIYKGFPFQIITGKPFFPLENLRDALASLTVSEPYRFRKSLGKGAPEGSEHFSLPIFSGDF